MSDHIRGIRARRDAAAAKPAPSAEYCALSAVVRKLSANQRQMLIEHIDGSVGIVIEHLHLTRYALVNLGLLRTTQESRPHSTSLTEKGRMTVAMILADCADMLVQAGILEQGDPLCALKVLLEMKQAGRFVPAVTRRPIAGAAEPAGRPIATR